MFAIEHRIVKRDEWRHQKKIFKQLKLFFVSFKAENFISLVRVDDFHG